MAKKDMAETICARIGPGHKDLKEKFIPKWSPGSDDDGRQIDFRVFDV